MAGIISGEFEFRFSSDGSGLLRPLHVISVGDENLAGLATFGSANNAFLLQQIDEAGGTRVADVQPALEERRGNAGVLNSQLPGGFIQRVFPLLPLNLLARGFPRLIDEVILGIRLKVAETVVSPPSDDAVELGLLGQLPAMTPARGSVSKASPRRRR